MRKNLWLGMALIAGLVLFAGCAKAPQVEIDGARAALEAAKTAEAAEYAPRALASAQDAINAMDAELTAQQKKFALFRSYKKAKELIAAAKTAGDQAAQTAATEKEKARQEATNLIAQAKASLEEAKTMLAKAPRGKGSQADIKALESDLAGAEMAVTEAETVFATGKFLQAKAKANAAMQNVQNVKNAIQAAIEARTKARGGK
jgi:hypothetical protein